MCGFLPVASCGFSSYLYSFREHIRNPRGVAYVPRAALVV